jgi:hypothetical protein
MKKNFITTANNSISIVAAVSVSLLLLSFVVLQTMTIVKRAKVQRGWKSKKSQIAEGQTVHYNFVKPHRAWDGKTPAEANSLMIEGSNK